MRISRCSPVSNRCRTCKHRYNVLHNQNYQALLKIPLHDKPPRNANVNICSRVNFDFYHREVWQTCGTFITNLNAHLARLQEVKADVGITCGRIHTVLIEVLTDVFWCGLGQESIYTLPGAQRQKQIQIVLDNSPPLGVTAKQHMSLHKEINVNWGPMESLHNRGVTFHPDYERHLSH